MEQRTDINHTFGDNDLVQLEAYGTKETYEAGDLIQEEGMTGCDCIVTLTGHTDILVQTAMGEKRVGWMERGQFAGDVSVLTGERTLATDKSLFPRGALVFVDTQLPAVGRPGKVPFRQIMFDQDTGGAIRTAGRADIYLGEVLRTQILPRLGEDMRSQ